MFILINFALVLLYLLMFVLVYFLYERTAAWRRIVNLNIPVQAKDLLRGGFFGLLTIVVSLINELIQTDYSLPLFAITAILLSYFKNYISALYSLIPSLIFWGLKSGGSDLSIIIAISLFISLIIIEIIKWFNISNYGILSLSIAPISLINFLIASFGFGVGYRQSFEESGLPYLFAIICGFVFLLFIKFSLSSKLLYESANFKFEGWYRTGLAQKSFADFISSKRISRGFFGVMRIDFAKKLDDNLNEEIVSAFLESFRKKLDVNNLFFAVTKELYGFFIPFDRPITLKKSLMGNKLNIRENDDMLFALESDIKSVPTTIITSLNEHIEVSVKVGISLYGLESSSFEQLISSSSFALSAKTTKNIISLYDFREFEKAIKNNKQISLMDKNITLDDYAIYYVSLVDMSDKTPSLTYAQVKNISDYDYYETVNDIIYSKGWEATFNRYFAAEALKKAEGGKVGFDYSLTIFENNFDVDHFMNFIEQTGNKLTNIYLFIPKESFEKVKNFATVKNEIAKLEGVNFVIDNESNKNKVKRIFKNVEFVYRKFNSMENNFTGSRVISFDIPDEEGVRKTIANKTDIIGGNVFENKIIFTKFDKQSKIYLESIMKGNK